MANKISYNQPVLVIGLGRFGSATALELVEQGREVLGVERDADLVQKYSSELTHVVQADATNIEALRQLGADEFISAVVGVGTSIESSVLITANLADLEIKDLWAKAISAAHGKILSRIGAHHVIYPEVDAGERVAHLVSGRLLDFIEFEEDFAIVKMYPPQEIWNLPLDESKVRSRYNITVVGIKRPGEGFIHAADATVVTCQDIIIVSGDVDSIKSFSSRP